MVIMCAADGLRAFLVSVQVFAEAFQQISMEEMQVSYISVYNHLLIQQCIQCELQYVAPSLIGDYAVALQIEDFMSPTDVIPLSSVPVQF